MAEEQGHPLVLARRGPDGGRAAGRDQEDQGGRSRGHRRRTVRLTSNPSLAFVFVLTLAQWLWPGGETRWGSGRRRFWDGHGCKRDRRAATRNGWIGRVGPGEGGAQETQGGEKGGEAAQEREEGAETRGAAPWPGRCVERRGSLAKTPPLSFWVPRPSEGS